MTLEVIEFPLPKTSGSIFALEGGITLCKGNEHVKGATQESANQGKVTVSVHLTESQKVTLEEIIRDWDIEMATIGRRLIRHLIQHRITLLELLKKYQAGIAKKRIANRLAESRNYRICIRLLHEEKQKLNELANEWFYLPGELARILFELFIMGIIEKRDLWE